MFTLFGLRVSVAGRKQLYHIPLPTDTPAAGVSVGPSISL